MVIANGTVLTASPKENPDLFYGIRGGGSNFGIVIEFVYRLHDQPNPVYGGMMIYGKDQLQAVAKEIAAWWPTASPKECVNCGITRGPDHNVSPCFIRPGMSLKQSSIACYPFDHVL